MHSGAAAGRTKILASRRVSPGGRYHDKPHGRPARGAGAGRALNALLTSRLVTDEDLQAIQRYELRDEDARADMMDEVCLHPR